MKEDGADVIASEDVFAVNTIWGRRLEGPGSLTARWMAFIARVQELHPLLQNWEYYEPKHGAVPYQADLLEQAKRVRDGMTTDVNGDIVPNLGTTLWLTTNPRNPSLDVQARIRAGNDNEYSTNSTCINTNMDAPLDPRLLNFDIIKGLLLATAEVYDSTQGVAWPLDLKKHWVTQGISQTLDLGWMTYVAPRFADLVTPPSGVVVETRPNGGLFMAATDEIFRSANSNHLAAATRIRDSLTAFNAVPWTKETGK